MPTDLVEAEIVIGLYKGIKYLASWHPSNTFKMEEESIDTESIEKIFEPKSKPKSKPTESTESSQLPSE